METLFSPVVSPRHFTRAALANFLMFPSLPSPVLSHHPLHPTHTHTMFTFSPRYALCWAVHPTRQEWAQCPRLSNELQATAVCLLTSDSLIARASLSAQSGLVSVKCT